MRIKITGLDKIHKKIDKMAKAAKEFRGEHEVKVSILLTDSFIKKHTNFTNLQEFFNKSGFKINTQEEFNDIPDEKWNEFINENSSFNNWEEMLQSATEDYAKHNLGF